jgi:hypothetical protein
VKDDLSNFHKQLVTALSCVSVPISTLQQRHLASISEFNVQMLYLPGLKNVVVDFLSCPSPPPPESAETVAASVAEDPVDFEAVAAEQNHCAETQHLLSDSTLQLAFAKQAFSASLAMSQQVFFAPLSHKNSEEIFFHFHNISHPGRLAGVYIIF